MSRSTKIEIGKQKPEMLKELWPGQYEVFSHFEYVSGVPQVLFLVTTLKANGKPNVCFHSWSSFYGDVGGYYAVMGGMAMYTHTYQNILREKEFCIGFISPEYYDGCIKTISENSEDADEFEVGGFTIEPSRTVKCPRIKEAFLSFECTLQSATDLSGKGICALVVGQVQLAAVEENNHELGKICGKDGFMFNVHSPKSAVSGEGQTTAVAILDPVRIMNE